GLLCRTSAKPGRDDELGAPRPARRAGAAERADPAWSCLAPCPAARQWFLAPRGGDRRLFRHRDARLPLVQVLFPTLGPGPGQQAWFRPGSLTGVGSECCFSASG